MRTSRTLALFSSLLLLLCPAPCARAQGGGAADEARRLASEADDHARTVEARRESVVKLEESARLSLEAGGREEAARALNRAGLLLLLLNDDRAALAAHRRALSLLTRAPSAEAEADALNGMGETYASLKQKERAEGVLRRALELSERAGYVRGRARALLALSDVWNYDGQRALAQRTAEESLALWQALGDARGQALAHAELGRYLMAQSHLAESALNYERALQLWRELNDPAGQADALISLGQIEARRGEWQSSLNFYTQAERLVDAEAEPLTAGRIVSSLAGVFNELGEPEKGLAHFGRALEIFRRVPDPAPTAYVVWKLGCTHLLLGEHDEALARFREVFAVPGAGDVMAATAEEYIARVHIERGEEAEALPYLNSALAVYTRTSNVKEAAEVRALIGRAYERQGQPERARAAYRAALVTFDALSDRVGRADVCHALGRLELRGGNLAEAEGWLRRSVELTEEVRRVSGSSDLAASFRAAVHERYESYVECLMRRHAAEPSRGFDALAFESSESARARSLSELLRATGTNLVPGLDPRLAERERALRQSLRAREDDRVALLGGEYTRPALEALDADIARLRAEYARAEEEIRARHPSYGQLARPAGWDLGRIRREVVADDETVLLEYGLGAERSYVWAVTREGLRSYELPPREVIQRAAERAYTLLSTARRERGGAEEVEEAARELSRMLLSPAAASLQGRSRVIVVADGGLDYVPFQILPAPADGEPLVAGHEVVNAPSASVLGQLREEAGRRLPRAKTLAAFGDPVFASSFAMRKGGGVEVAALRQREAGGSGGRVRDIEVEGDSLDPASAGQLTYAGPELRNLREVVADSHVAEGFDATRERLRETDLSEFAVLHFATHGLLNPKEPEKSGLLLSTVDLEGRERGGFVGLRDVYSLRAPVELVVLSACRTALGKEVRGEGMIGLTRGFLYAGASSVVSSLWKVDDEATSELMRRFYENMLRRGMTPAAALREAQNSIRREPHWRSPYYWAAFTLQGEYRQVLRPAPAAGVRAYTKTLAAGGVLLALAALAAWWLRRRRAASLT
ncbi:MAG: CHAT domain-containing protein [Acidobacteria bacterium]|nr:CHAT domain-containing protein [Acidobacteriota bacterium]